MQYTNQPMINIIPTNTNIAANVEKLQKEIIPHMESWAVSSGATF